MANKIKMPEDISGAPETTVATVTPPVNIAARPRRPRRVTREPATAGAAISSTDAGGSAQATVAAIAPRAANKITRVIALLGRDDGATLAELVAATGWLPHTTRAALTGLRKKGHTIIRDKRGETTCYRIASAA